MSVESGDASWRGTELEQQSRSTTRNRGGTSWSTVILSRLDMLPFCFLSPGVQVVVTFMEAG